MAVGEGIWMIKGGAVNLRDGPSAKSKSLGKLNNRQPFKLLQDPEGGWVKVSVSFDGVPAEGWVGKKFVTFVKPFEE
jgi:uncharacterized protein YgiM (DUF1202 family)